MVKVSIEESTTDKALVNTLETLLIAAPKREEVKKKISQVNVKRKANEDKLCCEKLFGVDEDLDGDNLMASSYQVRGNDEDEIEELIEKYMEQRKHKKKPFPVEQ
ncbi:hypothetical protein Tco_1265650 [Tanacetum coccineum]